ncbi:MAG: hypothetical protein QXH20_01305 [Candidatus Bathyarchaeia archaeon]
MCICCFQESARLGVEKKNVLAAEPYPTIAKFYYSSVTKGGEISVIWFDHLGSANLAKDYFNYLWRGSEE